LWFYLSHRIFGMYEPSILALLFHILQLCWRHTTASLKSINIFMSTSKLGVFREYVYKAYEVHIMPSYCIAVIKTNFRTQLYSQHFSYYVITFKIPLLSFYIHLILVLHSCRSINCSIRTPEKFSWVFKRAAAPDSLGVVGSCQHCKDSEKQN
jgi:hypothetical protein